MTTGFGDTVSNPDNYAGAGVVESVFQFADSCTRAGEGDVAEIAMNGAALGLDALGFMLDPLGSLATAGIGWLIEHISFLREPLDWFAGDPDEIKAACATWNDVARNIDDIGTQQEQALQRQVQSWEKAAAEAFRRSHGQLAGEMHAVGAACTSISSQIASVGTAVGAIRGMIRDLISTFVWEVIRNAVIALAGSAVTFGGAAAAFAAWTVGRAAMVLGKIAKFVSKIVGVVGKVLGRIGTLMGKVGDLVKGLGRFGRGGSSPDVPAPTRASGATDAPNAPSAGQRLEDWGRQKSDPVQHKYNDAGNVWAPKADRASESLLNGVRKFPGGDAVADGITRSKSAVDQYSPFKPKENEVTGHIAAHSRPDIANNGLVTKFSGDLAREMAKYDELQNEVSVPEEATSEEAERIKEEDAQHVQRLRERDGN